jgi:predicted ATP-grasp superfamily ATP-dependent carboligase
VGCASSTKWSLAASSRCTTWRHLSPGPHEDLEGFLHAIEIAINEIGYDVVLPSSDAETLALSFGRDRLNTCVPYPSHDNVVRAFDKLDLAEGARRAGLMSPRTVIATDEALAEIDRPVVVKARLHWAPGDQSSSQRWEAEVAADGEEAARRAAEIRGGGGEPLIQDLVDGRIMHCHLVVDRDGAVIASVRQLSEALTWPPDAGTRVRSVTVPKDDAVEKGSAAFLEELGWFGFASLQFIQPDDGPPQVIDFNGRLSLSFEQSIAAGPNFPALWACVATGRPHDEVPEPKAGVRYQWFEGDLHRALVERRGGFRHDVMDTARYARGAVHGIWRLNDPRPALSYWAHYVGVMFRNSASGLRGRRAAEKSAATGPESTPSARGQSE